MIISFFCFYKKVRTTSICCVRSFFNINNGYVDHSFSNYRFKKQLSVRNQK